MLSEYEVNGTIPDGYGLRTEEESYTLYETVEYLLVGKKRKKKTHKCRVILPESVWLPRVILWVQAIECMYIVREDVDK